jgi:hypothetical protein
MNYIAEEEAKDVFEDDIRVDPLTEYIYRRIDFGKDFFKELIRQIRKAYSEAWAREAKEKRERAAQAGQLVTIDEVAKAPRTMLKDEERESAERAKAARLI